MEFVKIERKALEALIAIANSHIEDIETGIEEGIYVPEDNEDLPEKVTAVMHAEKQLALNPVAHLLMEEMMLEQKILVQPSANLNYGWTARSFGDARKFLGRTPDLAVLFCYMANTDSAFPLTPDFIRSVIDCTVVNDHGGGYALIARHFKMDDLAQQFEKINRVQREKGGLSESMCATQKRLYEKLMQAIREQYGDVVYRIVYRCT